jgi:hypothetical protein
MDFLLHLFGKDLREAALVILNAAQDYLKLMEKYFFRKRHFYGFGGVGLNINFVPD